MITHDPSPFLHGHVELETTDRGVRPHRLPAWARRRCPDPQLLMAEGQPAGVRLVLRTAATVLEVDAVPTKRVYPGAPPRPDGVHELEVALGGAGTGVARASLTEGDVERIDLATGARTLEPGPVGTLRFADLPAGEKTLTLWLPHDETTALVAVRTDAPAEPVPTQAPRWVHHGSSLSQGSNAASPTGTFVVDAARRTGAHLTSLGLGGSALLDPFVARTIRDLPADLVSMELGINLVNADLMRRRALGPALHGWLDTVRDGHPTTPVVLVSALHCAIHEATPGPAAFDPAALAEGRVAFAATGDPAEVAAGRLTLEVVREVMAEVVARREDPHLHLVDGLALFGAEDEAAHPLPDRLHLEVAGHALVGERLAAVLAPLLPSLTPAG
ncbi:SGNH/GDSL hydrolase family protein [Nocardioides bruguierae]|uniref:SGNH/GDSL hydrolase family protein n=1 Tax=Nocardioides bruguierae TaxID=2945102 RepID=UPI0020206D68|nr:SGNH/GDSL hydrolase family protein [Nocardioides bruguierae]MCL8025360.1 lipase [Nocardioides bruguierae]